MNTLSEVRAQIRSNQYQANTSGLMPDLVQGNVVVLPQLYANEFIDYCNKNPKPCPIIGVSAVGNPALSELGQNIDIRRDVPQYNIYRDGVFKSVTNNIDDYWHDDSVAIVLGCSFSFENALIEQGLSVRNITLNTNVSMYDTNIQTSATEHFSCNMVVTMRPFKQQDIERVIQITGQFPKAHGSPIHIGSPHDIGIKDLQNPEYGTAVPLEEDDVFVYWACGVTTQQAVTSAQLPLVVTHAPGKMLISDYTYPQLSQPTAGTTANQYWKETSVTA